MTVKPKRRPRWKKGSFVKIPLDDGRHAYGLLRPDGLVAVLDIPPTTEELDIERLVGAPVLFSVWVMAYALKEWPIVGWRPLPEHLDKDDAFVKRDPLSGVITIYESGVERPPRPGEAETLEIAGVWDPEHVRERIQDHYAGRPNLSVESHRNYIRTGSGKVDLALFTARGGVVPQPPGLTAAR